MRVTRPLPKPRRKTEEADLQIKVAGRLRGAKLLFCHCPNEGRMPVQYRTKLLRMGLSPGVPDILIFTPPPYPFGIAGVAIELKAEKGRVSAVQQKWMDDLTANKWLCFVARTHKEVTEILRSLGYDYGIPGVDY